eukprot:5873316-Amphidinium_carterae.2
MARNPDLWIGNRNTIPRSKQLFPWLVVDSAGSNARELDDHPHCRPYAAAHRSEGCLQLILMAFWTLQDMSAAECTRAHSFEAAF